MPAGAFVAGMQVVAIRDGQNLQFLTQSYADQFANINSQMENKANKWDSPSCFTLPYAHENAADEGISAGGINIFSWYGKSASNMGFLTLRAFAKEGDIIGGESNPNGWYHIATLPEGFRSKATITFFMPWFPKRQNFSCVY